MPNYPYSFQLPPLSTQDIPNDGAVGEFLGISAGGVLDWLPVASGGGDLLAANNLSELTATAGTARTNLGLGTGNSPQFTGLQFSTDTFLIRGGAANLHLGAADAAAPVAQTLSVQSVVAGTTNTAGQAFTIDGSQGTGTGIGGDIIFRTAPAGTVSGSSVNPLSTALIVSSAVGGGVGIGGVHYSSERLTVTSRSNVSVNCATFRNSSSIAKFQFFLNSSGNSELYLGTNTRLSETGVSYFNGGNVGIGTTAPGAPLHVQGTAVTNTRENLLKCTMSDAGNDAFHIYNGTGLDSRFSPAFSGSVFSGAGAAPALNFVGQTTSANDTGTTPLTIFQGRITSSETDPNNGTFSNVATRPLFGWWNVTTPLMQLNANGNLGIGTTAPTQKLDVAGAVSAGSSTNGYQLTNGTTRVSAWGNNQGSNGGLGLSSTFVLGWSSGVDGGNFGTFDTILQRDGEADHLAMRRTTNGQKFSVYGTYPGAAWERFTITAPTSGNVLLGTYKGTGGIARGLEFQTDGVSRWSMDASTGALIPTSVANIGSTSKPAGATYVASVNFYGGTNRLADFFGYHPHVGLNAAVFIKWESTSTITGANDVGIKRNDVGVLEVNNGSTAAAFRDLRVRSVIQQPPASITPASNGDYVVEATSNTTLTFKLKGTDGTVRTATLTLAP
jgi:hypothetical protein